MIYLARQQHSNFTRRRRTSPIRIALVPLKERVTRRLYSGDLEQVLVKPIATICDVMNQARIANERRIGWEQTP